MKRGMIVRHLILPGQTKDSKKILRYLYETYGQQWPSEIVKIIELAVWEYRQTSIFD